MAQESGRNLDLKSQNTEIFFCMVVAKASVIELFAAIRYEKPEMVVRSTVLLMHGPCSVEPWVRQDGVQHSVANYASYAVLTCSAARQSLRIPTESEPSGHMLAQMCISDSKVHRPCSGFPDISGP